jgi:hypothetical protein
MKCTVLLLLLLGAEVGALAATGIFSIDSISVLAQEQEDEMMKMDGGEEGEEGGRDPISYVTEYIGIFAIGTSFGLLIAPSIIGGNIESIPELRIRNKVFVFISVIALTIAVGIIHILLIKEHMEESYIWGIGFLVMGILQLIYGGVFIMLIKTQARLKKKRRRMVLVSFYSLGIIGNIVLVAIFIYARLFVPPFSPEGVPVNELEINGILTVIIELLITGLLVYLLQEERGEKRSVIKKEAR